MLCLYAYHKEVVKFSLIRETPLETYFSHNSLAINLMLSYFAEIDTMNSVQMKYVIPSSILKIKMDLIRDKIKIVLNSLFSISFYKTKIVALKTFLVHFLTSPFWEIEICT